MASLQVHLQVAIHDGGESCFVIQEFSRADVCRGTTMQLLSDALFRPLLADRR